jgi:hypothetical protein
VRTTTQPYSCCSAQLQQQIIFNDVIRTKTTGKALSPKPQRGVADRTHGPNRDKDWQWLCNDMKRVNDPWNCIGRDKQEKHFGLIISTHASRVSGYVRGKKVASDGERKPQKADEEREAHGE